ncbi:MAG: hypothetical protein JOZ98_17260 [Solirubrobacterales bacterium]|nr:hypothetical protein [Solirubrobacterales bacterium]MBV9796522.1 hypothetical protein [Solirubrobacterales bacterium]
MDREPDLEIAASVRADELRFECTPRVRVVVHADWPTAAQSGSDRENLPDQIEPGVTYRDAAVRWWASARLGDPDFPP